MSRKFKRTTFAIFSFFSAIAEAADPSFPKSISLPSEFLIEVKPGCSVVNPFPSSGETATWSGQCKNGRASGYGKLSFFQNGQPVRNGFAIYENGFYLPSSSGNFDTVSQTYLKSPGHEDCGLQLPLYASTKKPSILSLFRVAEFDCREPQVHALIYLNDQLFAIFDGRLARGVYPQNGTITYFTGTKFNIGQFPSGHFLSQGMIGRLEKPLLAHP